MHKLLEVEHLSVSYHTYAGVVQSVRDISFSIDKNKSVAIVGESGCGKTVTAKTLMGLIEKPGHVDENSIIRFDGEELRIDDSKSWKEYRGKKAAMIFQDALISLDPTMKIGKQIVESLENHDHLPRQERESRAEQMLKLVGIPDPKRVMKMYPHELSGGMRQRVMIASAFITNPQLLIADEPTTALDVTIQAQILRLMKELKNKFQMSVILITHDLGVVADFADEIIVMYAGKIVEQGSCEEIFNNPQHPYTCALLSAVPRLSQDKNTRLTAIRGMVPDMIHPPAGCAFCGRCPHAMTLCQREMPHRQELGDGHSVCCWLKHPEVEEKRGKKNGT